MTQDASTKLLKMVEQGIITRQEAMQVAEQQGISFVSPSEEPIPMISRTEAEADNLPFEFCDPEPAISDEEVAQLEQRIRTAYNAENCEDLANIASTLLLRLKRAVK